MSKRQKKGPVATQTPRFSIVNWILFAVGIAVIGLGFYSLWRGSITLAPILLVTGYCVLVPLALLLRAGKRKSKDYA